MSKFWIVILIVGLFGFYFAFRPSAEESSVIWQSSGTSTADSEDLDFTTDTETALICPAILLVMGFAGFLFLKSRRYMDGDGDSPLPDSWFRTTKTVRVKLPSVFERAERRDGGIYAYKALYYDKDTGKYYSPTHLRPDGKPFEWKGGVLTSDKPPGIFGKHGIYTAKHPLHPDVEYYRKFGPDLRLAKVRLSGKVVETKHGFRSTHARIVSVHKPRTIHGIPVIDYFKKGK